MEIHGWHVRALEPDDTAREIASSKLGIRVEPLTALLQQLPHSFDVITLWHVLEHVHDLNGYLKAFASILKPDGTLLVAVPNHLSADAKKYGAKWAAFDVPRHLWHFTPLSMEKLFAKHGFSITQKWNMPLDAFYVSMLSEQYKNGKGNIIKAFFNGFISNLKAWGNTRKCSSVIYVISKQAN